MTIQNAGESAKDYLKLTFPLGFDGSQYAYGYLSGGFRRGTYTNLELTYNASTYLGYDAFEKYYCQYTSSNFEIWGTYYDGEESGWVYLTQLNFTILFTNTKR